MRKQPDPPFGPLAAKEAAKRFQDRIPFLDPGVTSAQEFMAMAAYTDPRSVKRLCDDLALLERLCFLVDGWLEIAGANMPGPKAPPQDKEPPNA